MECNEFAVQVAEAFQQVLDLGSVYGALILVFGILTGYLAGRFVHREAQ